MNDPDIYGITPIVYALSYGKIEIVEILLRIPGIDLRCKTDNGWSLILIAIEMNKLGEKL